mgnify:CR=1
MKEMMENNQIIAEFMGCKHSKYEDMYSLGCGDFHYEDLAYDYDWNWLMPVIEKIESLGYVFTIQGGKAEYGETISETRCFIAEDKMSSTYKAVVEFIKEYNQNN